MLAVDWRARAAMSSERTRRSWGRRLCRMEWRMESWAAGESLDEPVMTPR